MSVVLQMKKPRTCRECFDTHRCFGTGEWYADGMIWCGLAKGYIGDERTKCPVIELPEGHGRLIDADAYDYPGDLKWEPTIVPAERSET